MSPSSTPERGPEVMRLFDGALELPEEERAAFVAQAADGDADLAAAVHALLDAEKRSRNVFEAKAVAVHEAALDELVTEPPPDDGAGEAIPHRIGRYRVIAELGRGGWGTVYHAERDTGDFEQRVAIKVLRRGLDTEDVLARFRAEGRILARLDHPGIARLLDGGATDDGRPFLTMELVDGQPITEYCRQRSLDVAARLRLFLDVARAVEYAHRNLVVHRDLKPSNILVSADGQVKLLDFGIAKLLGDEVGEDPDTPHTRTGVRPMTPEYASPEQVRGEPITTASDVYQLGLLLYELLTGFRPYAAADSSTSRRAESLRDEPTAPSAAVLKAANALNAATRDDLTAARRVGRLLRGDLDTIVLKALRRDSRHRYGSAGELIEDVERHLNGQPVLARPDRIGYRAAKFARRRPAAVAASVAALLAAGMYIGTLQAHAERLERERDAARIARMHAELAQAEAEAARAQAETALGSAESERNATRLERMRADDERERAESARAIAESQRRRAEAALRVGGIHQRTAEQTSQFLISLFRTAQPGSEARGDTVSARTLLLRGGERARTELTDQPEVAIELLRTIGEIQYDLGMTGEGRALMGDALAIRQRLGGVDHLEVARDHARIGRLYIKRRGYPQAEPHMMEAARILRAHPSGDPLELAGVLLDIGEVYRQDGRIEQAEAAIQEALALYRSRVPEHHWDVWNAKHSLAVVLRSQNRWDEAERLYRDLLAAADAAPNPTPVSAASLVHNLAFLLEMKGAYPEAEQLYRRALAAMREAYGSTDRSGQVAASSLASVLERQGRLEEAESLLLQEVELHRASFPEDHWRIGHSISHLAGFYQEIGRYDAAEPRIREVLAIYQRSLGADAAWTLAEQIHLALSLLATGRTVEAEAELLTVFESLQRIEVTRSHRESVEYTLKRLAAYEERTGEHELLTHYRSQLAAAVEPR